MKLFTRSLLHGTLILMLILAMNSFISTFSYADMTFSNNASVLLDSTGKEQEQGLVPVLESYPRKTYLSNFIPQKYTIYCISEPDTECLLNCDLLYHSCVANCYDIDSEDLDCTLKCGDDRSECKSQCNEYLYYDLEY